MTKLTQRLLNRAAAAAKRHNDMSQEITAAFLERYGQTHSDVDADFIIDVLDCNGGAITVAECDREMANCGAPRLLVK